MKKLLLNCPNCGAPLRHDGYCEYCGTKVRYENELDVMNPDLRGNMEILLKVEKEDHTVYIPLVGFIENITVESDETRFYYDDCPYITMHDRTYIITFRGQVSDRLTADQ